MVSSRPAVDDLSVQSARLASLTLEIPDNSDDESESSIPLSPSTDATTPTTDTHSPLSPFDASPKAVNASNSQSASELAREAESSPRRTRLNREREFRRNRFGSSSSRISYQRLQSPDRFLPDRQFQDTVTESFRLSEWPTQRPVRAGFARRLQGSSPFGPTNNTIVPITPPRRDSSLPRVFSPRHLPHRISTSVLEMGYAQTVPSRIPRPSGAAGGELVVRTDPSVAIPDGRGGYLGSGTVAPMHIAGFTAPRTLERDLHEHEIRISLALDVDRTSRVLNFSSPSPPSSPGSDIRSPVDRDNSPTWKDNAWTTGGDRTGECRTKPKVIKHKISQRPFRVLDAPLLRDDYYCSTLAYCYTARQLAVGLGSRVYLWSETNGVRQPPFPNYPPSNYITSLAFSSYAGRRSILAVGRCGGQVSLWSTFDSEVRFDVQMPCSVTCVAFKHTPTCRASERALGALVDTEDLVVGDETGTAWYFSVEWPVSKPRRKSGWRGSMTLLAKIKAHTQQICGIVWSPDQTHLVTGGNDNACLVYEMDKLLERKHRTRETKTAKKAASESTQVPVSDCRLLACQHLNRLFECRRQNASVPPQPQESPNGNRSRKPYSVTGTGDYTLLKRTHHTAISVPFGSEKHRLPHAAAVKALAFAPWQTSLLATGGGSNDRCLRFYHVPSGSCLATINVHSQVTSLIWSKTRREIAATFGYTQPHHPFRIAVFAWPSCKLVLSIPWGLNGEIAGYRGRGYSDGGRVLWAIGYPGAPAEGVYDEDTATQRANSPAFSASSSSNRGQRILSATSTVGSGSEPWSPAESSARVPQNSRCSIPDREGGAWWPRTTEEGSIVVASSGECLKFYEVWSGESKTLAQTSGLLGGSDLLETLEGIEKEGDEIIR